MPRPRIRPLPFVLAILLCAPMLRLSAQSVGAVTSADPLLDGSALNDIWLHINARDWQDLHTNYKDGTYYPVDFEWQGVNLRNSGIRVRGNTTRNDHKPSFRIDFNRYVDGLATLTPTDPAAYDEMGKRLGEKGYVLPK